MNKPAPTTEALDSGWTNTWVSWFFQVFQGLSGWNKSMTAKADYDFASIAAASEASTTVTAKGARPGDSVLVTPKTNTAGVIYSGVVTASDTVTIYAKNFTAGAIDPATTTFRVIVFQN